ncbi:MAG: DUF6263 family protein [Bacteroidetes bacterium]|nr:DUF6263 family protein [Bacteroidota bacterium]
MKKMMLLATGFLTILMITGLQSCQSTKSATATKMLRFNFENGKGYDYEMSMNMDQEIMGQPMKMEMTNYYSMDVQGDEGTSKLVTTQFDRMKMKMNVAGIDMDVDSDKKGVSAEKDPMSIMNRVFGAITGRRFTMKVNAEGKVEEVRGLKEMATAMVDSLGLEGADRDEVMETFNKSFNEKDMKGQFERVLYIFPNKVVKVGDTWDRNTDMAGQMAGTYKSTFTVKEIEGDMVTLEEKTKIEGSGSKEIDEMSGNVSGILVVDSRSGLVVNADQDITMRIEKNGQKMTINAKNKVKGKARG